MNEQYEYLGKFSVIKLGKVWEKEFEPLIDSNPAIGELLKARMEAWVKGVRSDDPDFANDLELPIRFDPNNTPLRLQFYVDRYGPGFDADDPPRPNEVSYWRKSSDQFLFSSFWYDLCRTWMPEGNWVRLDSSSHSILLELNSRTVFDPEFHASRSAEYILDMLIIGEPVRNADYKLTSSVIAWLNYHLKWHSRYNLPEVFEKALRHDLPEYLQIMQTFANVEIPALKSQPLTATQLNAINALSAPVNRRMI